MESPSVPTGLVRRPLPSEIAFIVRWNRDELGIKQEELARRANVSVKTLERIETGADVVSVRSYALVARALGFPDDTFVREVYMPTLEEIARRAEEVERDYAKITLKAFADVRDVLALFDQHGMIFDESQLAAEHLADAASLKQNLADSIDCGSDVDASTRLEFAEQLLTQIHELEALGYRLFGGTYQATLSVQKGIPWRLSVVLPVPNLKVRERTTYEALLPRRVEL